MGLGADAPQRGVPEVKAKPDQPGQRGFQSVFTRPRRPIEQPADRFRTRQDELAMLQQVHQLRMGHLWRKVPERLFRRSLQTSVLRDQGADCGRGRGGADTRQRQQCLAVDVLVLVLELTRRIKSDADFVSTLLPVRDGVMVSYRVR